MGLSEYFYSWAVSMYSVGELISAPLSGFATKYIPYRYTILLSSILLAAGSLLYAVAVQGWMVLIARLLLGLNVGSGIVLVTTYLGETAIEVTSRREAAGGKKGHGGATLKDKLFIWYTFANYIGYLVGLGELEINSSTVLYLPPCGTYYYFGRFSLPTAVVLVTL